MVASVVGSKNSRQCFDRHLYLSKEKEASYRHMWTATEAVVFDKAFDDMPFQWDDIQQIYFPELTVT